MALNTKKLLKSIQNFKEKLSLSISLAVAPSSLRPLGKFAIDLIVKRTRLGYGVDDNFGIKSRLKSLSQRYIEFRKQYPRLSGSTRPTKSNLTLTGQMLGSMKVLRVVDNKIVLGPSGNRNDGLSNAEIAGFQEDQGRIFNRLSGLEYKQLIRFYRKNFGDLLKKKKLLK